MYFLSVKHLKTIHCNSIELAINWKLLMFNCVQTTPTLARLLFCCRLYRSKKTAIIVDVSVDIPNSF